MTLACTAPWTGLFVWTDGTISYCGRLRASGDLRRQTFAEFWNSPPVRNARGFFLNNQQIESGCPPTCCWLTAQHPETFVRYFDVSPAPPGCRPVPAPAIPAERWILPPQSHGENRGRIAREVEAKQSDVSSFPTSLSISMTNYCSLRCPMCCFGIIPPDEKKPTARLIDPIVLDRLKVVYPYIVRLDLLGGELFDIPFEGNPLVRVLTDVADSKSTDIRITITTNGQHLNRQWADFLMQSPFIDIIAFSVDSFIPEVYARTRVMGSLDRVRHSIRCVQEAKAARGVSSPALHLNSILGVDTHDGVQNFVDNGRALGVDEVYYQKLVLMGDPKFFAANNLFQPHHVDKLVRLWRDLAAADFKSNRAEIIGMIEAYLSHLGCRDAILRSDVDVPLAAHYDDDAYVGPIWGENQLRQAFVARRASVSRIKFAAGTYMRTNTDDVLIGIEQDRDLISETRVNCATLIDNAWISIELPRAHLDIDREYRIVIRAPWTSGNNAIAARCSSSGQGMRFGLDACAGELAYMLF